MSASVNICEIIFVNSSTVLLFVSLDSISKIFIHSPSSGASKVIIIFLEGFLFSSIPFSQEISALTPPSIRFFCSICFKSAICIKLKTLLMSLLDIPFTASSNSSSFFASPIFPPKLSSIFWLQRSPSSSSIFSEYTSLQRRV